MSTRNAVIIVAKCPQPGYVKTRLCPPLTPEQAAALARAFLEDAVECARWLEGTDAHLGFDDTSDPRASAWFAKAFPDVPRIPQGRGDLGARLNRLCEEAFRRGYRKVVLVGADTPLLTAERLREALDALSLPQTVVIGPAADGGYYLIGLTAPCPALFRNVHWSTATVLSETLYRARSEARFPYLLGMERDIDTPDDLEWLKGMRPVLDEATATARLLRRLFPSERDYL